MNKQTESVSKIKRRELLKMLTASGIAVGVTMLTPDVWVTPAIAAVESAQAAPEAIDSVSLVLSSRDSIYNRSTLNASYCIPTVTLNFSYSGSPILNSSALILSSSNLGAFNDSIDGYGGVVSYFSSNSTVGQITFPYPGEVQSGSFENSAIRVMQTANTSSNTVFNSYTVTCSAPPTAVNMAEFDVDEWSVGPVATVVAGAAALGAATVAKVVLDGDAEKE